MGFPFPVLPRYRPGSTNPRPPAGDRGRGKESDTTKPPRALSSTRRIFSSSEWVSEALTKPPSYSQARSAAAPAGPSVNSTLPAQAPPPPRLEECRLFSYRGLRIAVVRSPSWHLPPDRSLILRISRPPALNAMALAKLGALGERDRRRRNPPEPSDSRRGDAGARPEPRERDRIGHLERPRVREPEHGRQSDRRLRRLEQTCSATVTDTPGQQLRQRRPGNPLEQQHLELPGVLRPERNRRSQHGAGDLRQRDRLLRDSSTSTSTRGSKRSTRVDVAAATAGSGRP